MLRVIWWVAYCIQQHLLNVFYFCQKLVTDTEDLYGSCYIWSQVTAVTSAAQWIWEQSTHHLIKKAIQILYSTLQTWVWFDKKTKYEWSFFVIGLVLYAAADRLTELSDMVRHALLMLVGVVTPLLIIKHLNGYVWDWSFSSTARSVYIQSYGHDPRNVYVRQIRLFSLCRNNYSDLDSERRNRYGDYTQQSRSLNKKVPTYDTSP